MPAAPEQVRLALDRILASEGFASAARLSRFLRHVVERTLAGEGDRLKEYAIGVEVFDRDGDYDPRLDSIVRVEAARLRAKLADYYRGPGAADPVVIRMRKGSYAPEFQERPRSARASTRLARPAVVLLVAAAAVLAVTAVWQRSRAGHGPISIAVLPFAHYSSSADDARLAARLTDGVTSELARTGGLSVVSHTSALQFADARRPLREIAQTLGADVVLEATVLTEVDRIRVRARLVDGLRDRKIWVDEFAGRSGELDLLQRRVAAAVAQAANHPGRRPR